MARSEAGKTYSSAQHGESTVEFLERYLLDACVKYLEVKDRVREATIRDRGYLHQFDLGVARGTVRGLAHAVAKMRYAYQDQSVIVKRVEKEFIRKAKDNG